MKQTWHLALGLTIAALCAPVVAGQAPSAQVMLEAARKAETIDGNPKAAIAQYEQIVKRFASDRAVVADALVRMAGAYKKLGDKQATALYQRVVKEYGDQVAAVKAARTALGTSVGEAAPRADVAAVRRVWTGPDVDITGMVSPDGRFLSFTDWQTGDLALRDLETGTTRRLTNKGPWEKSQSYAERSVFSPDGRYVAYGWALERQDGSELLWEVRILDLNNPAAAPRRLSERPVPWIAPYDWSPDGRWIAVIANTDGTGVDLHVIEVESGEMRRLLRDRAMNGIRFTPDSRAVVIDRAVPSSPLATDVVAVPVAGGPEHVLVAGGGRNVPLGWSPDGGLLFASTRSGSQGLYLQPVQQLAPVGRSVLLKGDIGMYSLGRTDSGALYVAAAAMDFEMQTVRLDVQGSKVEPGSSRTFESYAGVNMHPAWSPDGTSLAYMNRRDRSGRGAALVIRSMATQEERELMPALVRFSFPQWFPDGKSLVVAGTDLRDRQGLFRIDANSGDVSAVLLAAPQELLGSPNVSPDGSRLYFRRASRAGGGTTIIERVMSTGEERVLYRSGFVQFALSTDGTSLAITERDAAAGVQTVRVITVAGGDAREVFRHELLLSATVGWMRDGKGLVALVRDAKNARQRHAVVIPVDGGSSRSLDLPDTITGPIAVHLDGRQLAYQMGERLDEVWVLENFLPPAPKAARN